MITASLEGKHLKILAGPRDTARLQQIPGARAHVREGYWTVPAHLYQAKMLRSLFGEDFTYGGAVADWARQERMREMILCDPIGWAEEGYNWERNTADLYGFQKFGASRLLVGGGTILADRPGLGKTVQALTALRTLLSWHPPVPALVVTTRTMKRVWAREAARWCPEAVPYVVAGTAAQRVKQLESAAADPNALVIINWESLRRHSRLAGYGSAQLTDEEREDKELNAFNFQVVIADEAHRAKDPKAKQTRALWALSDKATWRWALTGTPLANDYVDVWSLLRIARPEEFPTRGKFLDRYVVMIERPWGREPLCLREETKAELMEELDLTMLRRTAAECPELAAMPEVREVRVDLELSGKQATAYKKFKKEGMAKFGDNLLTATDPLSKLSRLRYLASATPVVEEDGTVSALTTPSNKVDAMIELFEDEALPAVVFAQSSKLIDLAASEAERKGYRVAKITGAMNDRQRELAVEDFQAGQLDAVFCTAAGGEGITLTAGKSMIFLQDPDSLIQMQQMMGRVPRIGNERDVVVAYHLVSEGTVDEAMYDLAVTKTLRLEEIVRDEERLGKVRADA
jgi:SNF2 family DNA or RNA helicase